MGTGPANLRQTLKSSSMALFLKRYFSALSVLVGVMVVYCLTIVPWIEPRDPVQYSIPEFNGPSGGNRWWESIFTAQDWQNQQPTVVQNSRGVLLAKTWEQVDQRTWKLTPLTIVLTQYDHDVDDEQPNKTSPLVWVVNAQEGATIHFDQPLDLNSGRVPSIQRGQLEGEIVIHRVSLANPEQPTLQLRTRNLSIDRRQIWTQEEVSVVTNDLLVRGQMLRIHLMGDILSQPEIRLEGDDDSHYGLLDEIELMHLTESKMRLKNGGLWAGITPQLLTVSEPVEKLPAHVEAQCGGRFSINFNKEVATLSGGVQLRHFLGSYPPDEFLCHRIQLKFHADSESLPIAGSNHQMPGLSVREIEAFGIDSLEDFVGEMWVEVKSPLADAYVRAKRVRYDFRNQRIELSGKLNQPGATMSVAEINYRGYHLRAPALEYQAAPLAADGRPQHGGWMVAQGAGEAATPGDSPLAEVHVRWQDRFQWSPADRPGQQRLEIVGQTLVESKQHGFVTSERLQLWLSSPTQHPDLPSEVHRPDRFQPRRLVTLGPTQIDMGGHQLQVESMDLNFAYPTLSATEPAVEPELNLQDSSGNPMFQFLTPPPVAFGSNDQQADSNLEGNGFRISGRSLVASLAVSDRAWIETMTLQGPLSLKSHNDLASPNVEIVGQTLVLASTPDGNVDLEIEGSPAKVNLADGSIEGPSIRLNQQQNQLWMDHPGTFTLPTNSLSSLQPRAGSQSTVTPGSAQTAQWQRPLTCSWQGRLLFDGQSIRLDGGIRMQGAVLRGEDLWLLEGLCQSMNIELSQPINLRKSSGVNASLDAPIQANSTQISVASDGLRLDPWSDRNALSSAVQVSQITLSQQVDLRMAQRDSTGQRQSLQRLEVPEVKVLVAEEKVVAFGPGRGIAKFYSGRSIGSLASNQPASDAQLQCAHLTFRDSLTALLANGEVVVDGNVNIVTSPIGSWEQEFDPYALSGFSPGQMSLASDQLKVLDTSALNSTQTARLSSAGSVHNGLWEIQATGNVVFEGSSESGNFAGNAYQVSYVQAKELLSFRGDGRTKALLRRTPRLASGVDSTREYPTVIQVPVASLNVRTMAIDVPQGGLDLQVDIQAGQGNNGPGEANKFAPALPGNPAQPPSPRDSINNFRRGK